MQQVENHHRTTMDSLDLYLEVLFHLQNIERNLVTLFQQSGIFSNHRQLYLKTMDPIKRRLMKFITSQSRKMLTQFRNKES